MHAVKYFKIELLVFRHSVYNIVKWRIDVTCIMYLLVWYQELDRIQYINMEMQYH